MNADLTPEERAELFAPDRRLTAYYFSFDATGSPTIDAILSAVAIAGKGCHHTNGWTERDEWARWGEGRSLVDVIQAAADNAAAERDALAAKVERVRELALNQSGPGRWARDEGWAAFVPAADLLATLDEEPQPRSFDRLLAEKLADPTIRASFDASAARRSTQDGES